MQRQTDLPQIVLALHPPRRLARRLNGWKQESNKNAKNRHDDQQFNDRETNFASRPHTTSPSLQRFMNTECTQSYRKIKMSQFAKLLARDLIA
jgi:hypothetical protein